VNLDRIFSDHRDSTAAPSDDDLAVRRWMAQIESGHRRRSTEPNVGAEARAELELFTNAERALAAGRTAERRGDVEEAIAQFTVAAEQGVGDSLLLLAGALTRAKQYIRALEWCELAVCEGFDEAVDLAARCRAALGLPAPAVTARPPAAPEPAPAAPAPEKIAGRGTGPTASADLGLTRRLKALACTVPLHELDYHKAKLDWVDASVYQMAEIAMHMIDQVTIAMDFDTGAVHDAVQERVTPFVTAQAPGRGVEEHRRVARWVLEKLINVGTVDRVFRHVYGEIGVDGDYRRLTFDFKLVREVPGVRGEIYLRTTDEAINVLVGALDTDVESAQVAAEVKLGNLIVRGQLADARVAAEQARYRTVQYGEMLRHKLDATRRDLRVVDWEHELPDMLDKALGHIEERFKVEHAILHNITRARDESDDPDHKRRAAELVTIVADCIRRHTQLQSRIQSARAVFREEQDRQRFSGSPQRAALDLHGQLLKPVLALPVVDAVVPLEQFFRAASGVENPDVPTLPSLVSMLLRPTVDRDRTAGPVVVPDLDEKPDDKRFTDDHKKLADALLDLPGQVRTLSSLLHEAADFDNDLPALVSLRASNAYNPSISAAMLKNKSHVLVAVPANRLIESPGGATGDDLLLTSAEIVVPAEDQNTVHEESA
jgi:tetratricopeptide (TPR) repeat protein